MDLQRVHEKVARVTPISYEQMLAAASILHRQPERVLLAHMLGLDGIPTNLNMQAAHRKRKEQEG